MPNDHKAKKRAEVEAEHAKDIADKAKEKDAKERAKSDKDKDKDDNKSLSKRVSYLEELHGVR